MSLYEGMFLLDNRQANRDWEGSLGSVKAVIEKHGGEILRCDKWGERRLAYEVEGHRRGTYVLAYFNAEGDAVNRIYRDCELSELILRVLMLQVSSMPSEEDLRKQTEAAEGRGGRRSSESRGRRSKSRDERKDEDTGDEDTGEGDKKKSDEADTGDAGKGHESGEGEAKPEETAEAAPEPVKSETAEEKPEETAEAAPEPVKSETAEEKPEEPAPGAETEAESDEEKS